MADDLKHVPVNGARPPWWVVLIIVVLAAIDPVMHWVNIHYPPPGTEATTLHTLDTIIFYTSMEHALPPYTSPYALCDESMAAGDVSYFALTYHHLYGLIGLLGRGLNLAPVYTLGFANGLAMMAYLYSVWIFLCLAVPRLARPSFLLFSLGGGLGGWSYLIALFTGFTEHAGFASYFHRYFYYELCEGARAQPYLMITRLYYTLPMALGFGALSTLCYGAPSDRKRYPYIAGMLLMSSSLINFRVGSMVLGAALLLLLGHRHVSGDKRFRWCLALGLGTALGVLVGAWLLRTNPDMLFRATQSMRSPLWLSPFISATIWYWILVPVGLFRVLRRASTPLRWLGILPFCYVSIFVLFFVLYQAYYGNFWRTAEFTAALRISDWALLVGLPIGILLSWRRDCRPGDTSPTVPPWIACWCCGLLALSISAFGHGYWVRFQPDRLVVMLGLPLAILGAASLVKLGTRHPICARFFYVLIVSSGLLSCGVTWLVTYGPFGHNTLQQAYPWTRNAFMSENDQRCLAALSEGRVLAPASGAPLMGDLAVLRGNQTVAGVGAFDHTRSGGRSTRQDVAEFFAPETTEALRAERVAGWCVCYIYCPDTDPVLLETRMQLQGYDWLEVVSSEGEALLFLVRTDGLPEAGN